MSETNAGGRIGHSERPALNACGVSMNAQAAKLLE